MGVAKIRTKVVPSRGATEGHQRIIRNPEFARRFEQACDSLPNVPAKHSGRQTWIQRQLAERFDLDVSFETVSKWFIGESQPRPAKMAKLAQLLQVDVAWLSLGVDPRLQPRQKLARNAMADGAVNVVAGIIQMDGGYPAFPEPDTTSVNVDLHAIIKGAKYDFHVSLGEGDGKKARFTVPASHDDVLVLGVVRNGFNFEVFEITSDMIQEGERHGGSIDVVVADAVIRAKQIRSFSDRP